MHYYQFAAVSSAVYVSLWLYNTVFRINILIACESVLALILQYTLKSIMLLQLVHRATLSLIQAHILNFFYSFNILSTFYNIHSRITHPMTAFNCRWRYTQVIHKIKNKTEELASTVYQVFNFECNSSLSIGNCNK